MIRILLIEDEIEAEEKFSGRLARASLNPELVVARSRTAATYELEAGEYDLVVCDLRIPSVDRGMDAAEEHGWFALTTAGQIAPGTPVILLSAVIDLPMARSWMEGSVPDLFGDGSNIPSRTAFNKNDGDAVMRAVQRVADALDGLDGIRVQYEDAAPLDALDERLLRAYAKRKAADSLVVERRFAGYSGATTTLCRLENDRGRPMERVVGKTQPLGKLALETGHYDAHVAHLGPGKIAQTVATITGGAGKRGAVIYALANGHRKSLYDVASERPHEAVAIVAGLRQIEERWNEAAHLERVKVRRIRRLLLKDDQLHDVVDQLDGIPWQAYEDNDLEIPFAVQHCDFHGGNVLLDEGLDSLLIDYADIADAPAALDAVTVELSLVLQEPTREFRGGWPSPEQAGNWVDIDRFAAGSPLEQLIRECRAWAYDVAGSKDGVAACAYAYSMRQLRYPDPDRATAREIIRGIAESS